MPTVLRLPISHYCHKVDWALADHGIKANQCVIWFRELADIRDFNPDNGVPILELEDRLICGSQNIMEWISNESPEGHLLYPSAEVKAWETWADEELGALARRDAYRTVYESPSRYTRNPLVWLIGRLARKLVLAILKAYQARRFYDQDDKNRPVFFLRIADQLRAGGTGFLFSEHKTAADYATAALIEPILRIRKPSQPHPDWDYLKAYVARVKAKKSPYVQRSKFNAAVRARLVAKAQL